MLVVPYWYGPLIRNPLGKGPMRKTQQGMPFRAAPRTIGQTVRRKAMARGFLSGVHGFEVSDPAATSRIWNCDIGTSGGPTVESETWREPWRFENVNAQRAWMLRGPSKWARYGQACGIPSVLTKSTAHPNRTAANFAIILQPLQGVCWFCKLTLLACSSRTLRGAQLTGAEKIDSKTGSLHPWASLHTYTKLQFSNCAGYCRFPLLSRQSTST